MKLLNNKFYTTTTIASFLRLLLKNLKSRKHFYMFIFCLLLLSSTSCAQAIGQVTDPINIKNALRGQTYSQNIIIVNSSSQEEEINLTALEDIAGWVKFYENSSSQETIGSTKVSARSRKEIIAKFTIPEGTPNGKYEGSIKVSTKPTTYSSKEDESGSSISQGIERSVSIEVNDKENISFNVSLIPEKYDMNKGDYLKIRIIYDNQSNVNINPQINLEIKQGEETFYSAIFPYPANQPSVIPYSLFEIPALEIPTSNLETGKYKAVLTMSQGEKYSVTKEFDFSVGVVKSDTAINYALPADNDFWSASRIILIVLFSILVTTNPRWKDKIRKIKK